MKLSVMLGVTGHRDLRSQDVPLLRNTLRAWMQAQQKAYPHCSFFVLSSLAEGADQLVARLGLELGMGLIAALPLEQTDYQRDFTPQGLEELRALLNAATEVFVCPDTERRGLNDRDDAYRQAGIYVARHCHVLIALWNGSPAKPDGCGTAECVAFKLRRAYRAPDTLLRAPDEAAVLQLVTPRRSCPEPPRDAFALRLTENAPGSLAELLAETERFNREAEGLPTGYPALEASALRALGPRAEFFNGLYQLADQAALRVQRAYQRALAALTLLGGGMVCCFLFYDELESNLFLMLYGLAALASFGLYLGTKKAGLHRRYIQYRLLAETLRVQLNLLASGLSAEAESLMSWSQRCLSPWVRECVSNAPVAPPGAPLPAVEVERVWIGGQKAYQERTHRKVLAQSRKQNAISQGLLLLTVLYSLAVMVLETGFGGALARTLPLPLWLTSFLISHGEAAFSYRGIFKLLLGLIPALTLLVTGYYGKLSLRRKLASTQRMAALYAEAEDALQNPWMDRERLLTELAREELAETGEWLAYMSENELEVLM